MTEENQESEAASEEEAETPEEDEASEEVEESQPEESDSEPEEGLEELKDAMLENSEEYYGSVEELYADAESLDSIDQYFDRPQGFDPGEEGLEGYLAVEDTETLLIGDKTAEDLDAELEAVDEALESDKGLMDKLKSYTDILRPEDRWDWTMYGGAALGVGGLVLGSPLALGTGLLIEGLGVAGSLYSRDEPVQEESEDEEDYDLGMLDEISGYKVRVIDEETVPE